MSVPNYSQEVKKLHATGLFDLKTPHGSGAFTDACVSMLNGLDENWGHLIKKPGQTDEHDHGEDSALYKLDDNQAQAVDFIGGAGGPNPQPGWIVDTVTPYTHADWHDPQDHGIIESAPPPSVGQPYPSESPDGGWWGQVFDVEVEKRYTAKGRIYPDPNDDKSLRWCGRTAYDIRDGLTKEASLAKHLLELEQELGL